MRRTLAAPFALGVIFIATFVAACGDGGGVRDPASTGPYGVGMTALLFTRPSSTTGEARQLHTVIWYPTDEMQEGPPRTDAPPATLGRPFPVVIFSHGDGGEPTQASYLTEHLASWGFVVAAPAHWGNTADDCPCDPAQQADSLVNRAPDIAFVLDQLLALRGNPNHPIGDALDQERAAATGYSFGGLTALQAARGDKFDVAVALAPGVPALLQDTAGEIEVPVLIMGSERDYRVDPGEMRALFEALPSDRPHHYIVFPQGGHHAFRDECSRECELPQERAHELTNRYVTAFLETYLAGDGRYARFLDDGQPPDALVEQPAD